MILIRCRKKPRNIHLRPPLSPFQKRMSRQGTYLAWSDPMPQCRNAVSLRVAPLFPGTKNATNFMNSTKNIENDRVKKGQFREIRVICGCLFGLSLKLTALGPTPLATSQRGSPGAGPPKLTYDLISAPDRRSHPGLVPKCSQFELFADSPSPRRGLGQSPSAVASIS